MVTQGDELSRGPSGALARTGLGRTGCSIPLGEQLRFLLDHALARDSVHAALDVGLLVEALRSRKLDSVVVRSLVPTDSKGNQRHAYLRRPDLGRRLDPQSRAALEAIDRGPADVAVVLADGLSALALERHAIPLLDALLPKLKASLAPIAIVTEGRVAIGDEIAAALQVRVVLVLIGERPGLTAPDSLGVYLTWNPQPGMTTDARRDCISNVRLEGLSYEEAAERILTRLCEAKRLGHTGVRIETPARLEG